MQTALILTKEFLENLSEADDIEFKTALGRDGKGCLPKDFFETYSAFANTMGGKIFLGVELKKNTVVIHGIEDVDKVKKQLFDSLNNPEKASINLVNRNDVNVHEIENKTILEVSVKEALRQEKPVYINGNPYSGTYRRQHEGDYKCPKELVDTMIREKSDAPNDSIVLMNFSAEDLDLDSVKAYRQEFKVFKPDHVINSLDDIPFLEKIGAWGKDRQTRHHGPTIAGLLMFGTFRSIKNHFQYSS